MAEGDFFTDKQRVANHQVSSVRVRIEHVNSSVKRCRTLREPLRLRRGKMYDMLMEIGCGLHNFRIRLSPWIPLIQNDPEVVAAFASHGVNTSVTLRPQEFSTGVDFKNDGMSVGFTSEFTLRGGVADLPILSSVVMKPLLGKTAKNWTAYTGLLPHGLEKTHSKDDVLTLLGEPVNLDEYFCSALWVIDGQELGILFTDDWKEIKQLGLSLPCAT